MGICSSNKNNKNKEHNKYQSEPNKLTTNNNTENETGNNKNYNPREGKALTKESSRSLKRKSSIHTRELNRISNKTILDGKINFKN